MFANEIHEKAHETLKSGEIEKAIVLYTKALELSKGHPDIISDRAVAYPVSYTHLTLPTTERV